MPESEKPVPQLSPHYYRDHFLFLLEWLVEYYPHVLDGSDQRFIRSFQALPDSAQCLYVRMANRRGACFRVCKLDYPEIADLPAALAALQAAGYVQPAAAKRPEQTGALLRTFTRPELFTFLKETGIDLPRSAKKNQLLEAIPEHGEAEKLLRQIHRAEKVVFQAHEEKVAWLNFLFFGNLHETSTQFVMQDMGHLRVEAREGFLFTPRYRDRREALDCYAAARARRTLREILERQHAAAALDFFLDWHQAHAELAEAARPGRDKMILHLAAELEKQGLSDEALALYARTGEPPSRERQARILYNARRVEEAYALAQFMRRDPRNADEEVFAADLLTRRQLPRSVKKTSVLLRRAPTIKLDGKFRDRVEQGVIAYYRKQGKEGMFAENRPWRNLFGLVCWEVLFPPDGAVLHHPLQTKPSDLHDPAFFERREGALTQCLAVLEDRAACREFLEQRYAQHNGRSNPFVDWAPEGLAQVLHLCARVPGAGLRAVLLEMARDLKHNSKGFPDLLLWSDTMVEWVEVKAPNDTLSARQLSWLNFFNEHGLPARVLKVSWNAGT